MQIKTYFLQKSLLSGLFILGTFTTGYTQQITAYVKAKIQEMERLAEQTDHGIDAITDFNGKNEFWSIDEPDTNIRSFYIWSYEQDILYTELFIEKDGMLDFAVESEKSMPLNHYSQHTWQCVYFLKEGKIIDFTSLGHGKTETDDWEPEEILIQFRNRKIELEKIKH